MKTGFAIAAIAAFCSLPMMAQATFEAPARLEQGENILPVEGYRAIGFYDFKATEDCLVTIILPTADSQVFLSTTPQENPTTSELPVMTRRYPDQEEMRIRFIARAGEQLYLKLSFLTWVRPEEGYYTFTTTLSPVTLGGGTSPEDAIQGTDGEEIYLPLSIDENSLMTPVYVTYHANQYGYLFLNFEPSVTQVKYRLGDGEGEFQPLPHTYLYDQGSAYGAKAQIEIEPGLEATFAVTGFSPAVLIFEAVDPDPGTMCEFPIDITPGRVVLPAAAGDWYYRITPEEEGCLEINSPYTLPEGYVQVMMDCNGFNAFTITGELTLRTFVWDRMEYLIHISKPTATAEDEPFEVVIGPELPCDMFQTAEPIAPGERISTPAYAGTYYYKINAPDLIDSTLKLTTYTTPGDDRTRANLYTADDSVETIARGLDMTYVVEPMAEYVLKYTVFDNRQPIEFSIAFEGGHSGIESIESEEGRGEEWFTPEGIRVGNPDRSGIYIRKVFKTGATEKRVIR